MILGRYPKPYMKLIPPIFSGIIHSRYSFGTIGRVFLTPVQVPFKCIVDAVMYEVGGTRAGSVRIGLYKVVSGYKPDGGPLVVQSGSEPQHSAYTWRFIRIPQTVLEPGLYYLGIMGSNTTGTFGGPMVEGYDAEQPSGRYFDNPAGYAPYPSTCPTTTKTSINFGGILRVADLLV
jgi:hypothetical protein